MKDQPMDRKSGLLIGCAALLLALCASANGATSQASAHPASQRGIVVGRSHHHDVTPPLRDIAPLAAEGQEKELIHEVPLHRIKPGVSHQDHKGTVDPLLQAAPPAAAIPNTAQNFEGVGNLNFVLPPDTNGDIGPNHYVQTVNLSFAVFDRAGNVLYGPADIRTLWAGFGGACESHNDGDPTALYDPLADRWLISQLAVFTSDGFHQCIAISQTGDPTGAWFRYDFLISATTMNDYPHFGVWPDAYYMTMNQFTVSGFDGAGAVAYERDEMLRGADAQMVYIDVSQMNPQFAGMLPSDVDGLNPPPPGSPNYFVEVDDDGFGWPSDRLQIFKFHVDWQNPANSSFTGPMVIDLTAASKGFDSNLCGGGDCITQPSGPLLDPLSDRLMYRLAYRNFGDHESLVVNHTVDADGQNHAGIRWYEIRNPGGNPPTLYQAGTYAPDTKNRWMGSIAMDASGDIALGFSISSSNTFPSIHYTGRLAADPLGVMTQGEGTIVTGSGSQTSPSGRWGDYSMMAVDPLDDCTFWYTQEYIATTGDAPWQTRVGAFKFPSCVPQSAGALQGTVTDAATNAPVAGVRVGFGGAVRFTDQSGAYSFGLLPVGAATAAASLFGYYPQSAAVTISNVSTTTQNFALTAKPVVTLQGTVTDSAHGWPLYARVDIKDSPASPVFTDPVTGHYSVTVPQDEQLTVTITAVSAGYANTSRSVTPPAGGDTEDFVLTADSQSCAAPGYQPIEQTFTNINPIYTFDFEATNGGFTAVGTSSWAWGVPTSGPANAHSGSKVWATNLSGPYQPNETGWLVSAPIDLSAYGGQTLVLSWWDFIQTELGYDYARVEVSHDSGATWRAVFGPVSGNVDAAWTQHRILLDGADAVSGFLVRFRLASDPAVQAAGFYVDDVQVSTAQLQTAQTVLYQPFLLSSLPAGWQNVDAAGLGQVWSFNDPAGRSNDTGGSGNFAILDSDFYGPLGDQNASLISPAVDVSALQSVTLEFDTEFFTYSGFDQASVDVTVNGGSTWTTVWQSAGNNYPGPLHLAFDITPLVSGQHSVQVRFHYIGVWEWWWEVDNVRIGAPGDTQSCASVPGGLVVGHVTDAGTSAPLDPATVSSDDAAADTTTTFNSSKDAAVGDGFYILFSSLTGSHSMTASAHLYVPGSQIVQVPSGGVAEADFALGPLPQFPLGVNFAGTGAGSVSSDPPGIGCNANCSANFYQGTQVTLSAFPYNGSAFSGWSGACSGTGACVITIGNSGVAVTATFDPLPQFPVNVTVGGSGAGSVTSSPGGIDCGATCSASFYQGTQVTLTANPNTGSVFSGWSGACSGTGTCVITIGNAPAAISATFDLQPDFALPPPPPPQTISAGGTATFPISVAGLNGFSGLVSFACTAGVPLHATCAFSPASITVPSNTTTTTLSVHTAGNVALAPGMQSPAALLALSLPFFGMGWIAVSDRRRRHAALLGLLILSVALLVSCGGGGVTNNLGGGGGGGGTPLGTYNVTVTASGAGVSHTQVVTVIVQ